MSVDISWVIGWFLVGLITFQVRGIKQIFTAISAGFSILSFLSLNSDQLKVILNFIGINTISGVFTTVVYLIGANISRFIQFRALSFRIIIYFFLLIVLLRIMQIF